MVFGFLGLSFWGYVTAALILTQITIASVTIYLHRNQAHRALTLHPIVSHFFRFWLWLTTATITKEWVAVHRKHHAATDVKGDPHSPVVLGLKKVFWQGAELYRSAAENEEMVRKYSNGTPDDWIERNLYSAHQMVGICLMLGINLFLFGIPGLTIWAVQMMWIPVWAAGVINGVGHAIGYRNHECPDASRNIVPWGIWVGGEELHNNHHIHASSAKFSLKWWEFDIGWFYIRCLSILGLAKVKKLPPKLAQAEGKLCVDIETLRAVIANRFQVMSQYYKAVIQPILQREKKRAGTVDKKLFQRAGALLKGQEMAFSMRSRVRLQALLSRYEQLRVVYNYRQSLQNVWLTAASSQKELLEALQLWCRQAEASGLESLCQFAQQLKGYVPKPV